ncbi:hypothetical protein [Tsuneonella sp. HG222]
MSDPTPIETPAGYAPAYAVGYADPAGNYAAVTAAQPLPVTLDAVVASPPPLTGEATGSMIAGPFAAVAGRVVSVTLDGSWQGTATLLRSTDGGATRQALRIAGQPWGQYAVPGTEQAWLETEDGAAFYLAVELTSGTLAYRVSQ